MTDKNENEDMVYVDGKRGSDESGRMNDRALPYAAIAGAIRGAIGFRKSQAERNEVKE